MNFTVLTLFPEMIEQGLGTSITGRALAQGVISLSTVNIRDFAHDRYGHVDDYPYGGGAGMVMMAPPVYEAWEFATKGLDRKPRLIYVTPQGQVFDQQMACDYAKEDALVFLCGHYEGVDERVLDALHAERVSIGDYVLTGGELPAMVMIDAIARMVPGVLSNGESGTEESFMNGLLEYPQYTRPDVFMGREVPEILKSGHHANIARWRRNQSLLRTAAVRPELIEKAELDKNDKKFLESLKNTCNPSDEMVN